MDADEARAFLEFGTRTGKVATASPKGKPHVAPGNDRRLVIDLPKLSAGTYTVIWHVTSVDTHKTEDSFTFHVGP